MIAVPSNIFREYDIRGVADRDLTNELARGVGAAFGAMIAEGCADGQPLRVAVGRDCRLSSPRLFESLVKGLVAAGVTVIDVGIGPTPMLYFAAHHLGTDGAVMITGSHNPGDENGFKMMRGKSSFFGADIQKLRERVVKGEQGHASGREGTVERHDVQDAYVAAMKERFDFKGKPIPFVVDAGNGAGGPLALRTMKALGLSPDELFCEMDGRFPNHHPDPTVLENIATLVERVRSTGARVGIAYDGDADRIGAVDEKGEVIWGDRLMILFSRALLKSRPGATILGEVKCSQTLYDDIAKHGGNPVVWRTGHSLIKTKMKETGALLAGEMSGHLFFADRYFGYDDAIYGSLRLLEILAADERPLSEMLADVPKTFTTPELRVGCPDGIKFQVVAAVTKHFKDKGNAVLDIDGARISFKEGASGGAPKWGLVRASNTGPVLVMRFEAGTAAELDAIRSEVERVVEAERAKLAS
jgi:phosphomannomutase/phosphoglucomutase